MSAFQAHDASSILAGRSKLSAPSSEKEHHPSKDGGPRFKSLGAGRTTMRMGSREYLR